MNRNKWKEIAKDSRDEKVKGAETSRDTRPRVRKFISLDEWFRVTREIFTSMNYDVGRVVHGAVIKRYRCEISCKIYPCNDENRN